MNRFFAITLVVAAVPPALAAQSFVSPPHALNVQGGAFNIAFTHPVVRNQQIDRNLLGRSITTIKSLSFRQGVIPFWQRLSTSRSVELQVDLGYAVSKPTASFDTNYKPSSRRTVHAKKWVNLPDWSKVAPTPTPFSLVIPFSTPFVYDNKESLVWDLLVTNARGRLTSYYMDFVNRAPSTTRGTTPKALGTGCRTANGEFRHTTDFTASATQFKLGLSVRNGPSRGLFFTMLGAQDPNAPIGLCTNLRSSPIFVLPGLPMDNSGTSRATLVVPWSAGSAGAMLYTQCGAIDFSLPNGIALTNGSVGSLPFVRGGGSAADLGVLFTYAVNNQASGRQIPAGWAVEYGL